VNPFLVKYILCGLATQSGGRAFIEAAEWNKTQLSSLMKTPFHRLGYARKVTIFGYTIVSWDNSQAIEQERVNVLRNNSLASTVRETGSIPDE